MIRNWWHTIVSTDPVVLLCLFVIVLAVVTFVHAQSQRRRDE